jgi:hypothetical protein
MSARSRLLVGSRRCQRSPYTPLQRGHLRRNILAAALWSMAAMMAAAASDPSSEPNDGVEDRHGVGVGGGKLGQALNHIVQPL